MTTTVDEVPSRSEASAPSMPSSVVREQIPDQVVESPAMPAGSAAEAAEAPSMPFEQAGGDFSGVVGAPLDVAALSSPPEVAEVAEVPKDEPASSSAGPANASESAQSQMELGREVADGKIGGGGGGGGVKKNRTPPELLASLEPTHHFKLSINYRDWRFTCRHDSSIKFQYPYQNRSFSKSFLKDKQGWCQALQEVHSYMWKKYACAPDKLGPLQNPQQIPGVIDKETLAEIKQVLIDKLPAPKVHAKA